MEKELRAELIDIKQKYEAQDKKIDRILSYLHNDTGTGERGLVAEVRAQRYEFDKFRHDFAISEAIQMEQAKQKGRRSGFFTGLITSVVANIIGFIFHVK